MYSLRQRIVDAVESQGENDNSAVAWLACVDNALANIFLKRGEWRQALGSWDRIIERLPESTKAEVQTKYATGQSFSMEETTLVSVLLTKVYKCEILSRQGRTLLQAGALLGAAEVFELAKDIWTNDVEQTISTLPDAIINHPVLKIMPCQMEVNEGLYYFAKSRYGHALQCFTRAVEILRKDDNFHARYRVEEWVGPSIAASEAPNLLYSESVGNMALCHLYECRMNEAVAIQEGLIREDPTAFFTERLAFNLCTLYELGSDSAVGTRKKRVLQLIAKRFFLHDVGPESFRIN